ncbi:MAG: glycosyltransferase family 87 protein [Vicinamibacterales bacterium]
MAIALVNMGIGIVLTRDRDRGNDFQTVRHWTERWLFDGQDLYASRLSGTDYPPHAILALSPISLLPVERAVPVWAAINLGLAIVAPILAARIVKRNTPLSDIACLAVLFLGWSGSKTLLQFTLLTLVFGLASVALAERHARWSGACLALAMMKPHVAAPFLLWALFTRRWKAMGVCAVVLAAGSLAWCLRASGDPLNVAVRYTEILLLYYTGEGGLTGVSQLAPMIGLFTTRSFAVPATALLSFALLAIVATRAQSGWRTPAVLYPVPAMAAVWSLLTFYHLTYGFVLLLPVAALLVLSDDQRSRRSRHALFWTMQVTLVTDLPGLWRRFGPPDRAGSVIDVILRGSYPVLLLCLFAGLWVFHRRELRHST